MRQILKINDQIGLMILGCAADLRLPQLVINPQDIYCTLIVITYIAHVQTSVSVVNM